MKIILSCRAIDNMAGGVERQIIALANAMVERDHETLLLTWDKEHSKSFYSIEKQVKWVKLNLGKPNVKANWSLRLKRLVKLRKSVITFNPDVIVAFQHGTFLGLKIYTLGLGVPIIASIRNAPSMLKFTSAGKHKTMIHQTLRMSDKITVQFKNYQREYPTYLQSRITTVPNAITPAKQKAKPDEANLKQWTLLAVGRFSFQKNFSVLIKAFALLSPDFPNWKLIIAGNGEQLELLTHLVETLHMQSTIKLPGAIDDIDTLYSQSHLFCLPSLWEGFPNALSEALAHGLPSVGFSDCDGINELIKDGKNGLLVDNKQTEKENIQSLAMCLEKLMKNPGLRKAMGKKAVKSMMQYQPIKVFDIWERALKETVQ